MKKQVVPFIFAFATAFVCCLNSCTKDRRPLPVPMQPTVNDTDSVYTTTIIGYVKEHFFETPIANAAVKINEDSSCSCPGHYFDKIIATVYTDSNGRFEYSFHAKKDQPNYKFIYAIIADKTGYQVVDQSWTKRNDRLQNTQILNKDKLNTRTLYLGTTGEVHIGPKKPILDPNIYYEYCLIVECCGNADYCTHFHDCGNCGTSQFKIQANFYLKIIVSKGTYSPVTFNELFYDSVFVEPNSTSILLFNN